MIVNGECGTFNPLLLRVPARCVAADQGASARGERGIYAQHGAHAAAFDRNAAQGQATPQVGRSIQALETERIKTEFFAKQSCGIQFDYDAATRTIL